MYRLRNRFVNGLVSTLNNRLDDQAVRVGALVFIHQPAGVEVDWHSGTAVLISRVLAHLRNHVSLKLDGNRVLLHSSDLTKRILIRLYFKLYLLLHYLHKVAILWAESLGQLLADQGLGRAVEEDLC